MDCLKQFVYFKWLKLSMRISPGRAWMVIVLTLNHVSKGMSSLNHIFWFTEMTNSWKFEEHHNFLWILYEEYRICFLSQKNIGSTWSAPPRTVRWAEIQQWGTSKSYGFSRHCFPLIFLYTWGLNPPDQAMRLSSPMSVDSKIQRSTSWLKAIQIPIVRHPTWFFWPTMKIRWSNPQASGFAQKKWGHGAWSWDDQELLT